MAEELSFDSYPFLKELGLSAKNHGALIDGKWVGSGAVKHSVNPSNKKKIAEIQFANADDYEKAVEAMAKARDQWMSTPMPVRGEIVRQIGQGFRDKKNALGHLISLQMGKILSEGLGEVQEAIDVCDMACGMSRQIGGQVLPSERPDHVIMEVWNPVGIVGVISAFNFPCAVFMWNAAIALICGDLVLWKNAPTVSLVTIATTNIIQEVFKKNGIAPAVVTTVQGDIDVGEKMVADHRVPVVSFTGSTKIGKIIQAKVAARFGKTILELGGNNCTIIMEDANVEQAFKACTFAAVGTCGQRCTTLRRLLIHSSLYDAFVGKLSKAYATICIGDPLDQKTLCGPLHSQMSVDIYTKGLEEIKKQGGKILCGGKAVEKEGFFVEPTIVEIPKDAKIVHEELFCPILYVFKFDTFEEAIQLNNSVPQGLSSSIFTKNIENVYRWIGPLGSDCGIVNVNMGPSGAEIGGAFGGEKETGGGRESGSDSWKQYMRRSTCAINYGKKLPLAQGVNFDV